MKIVFDFLVRITCMVLAFFVIYISGTVCVESAWGQLGYPSEQSVESLEAGFQNPPPGFGEVPFWWWTGDPLNKERLAWQIRELHEKGVAGMQVNYAHRDTPGWPTFPNNPEIFSSDWWDFWAFAAAECKKYDMGIGLSTYTLDWVRSDNLFNKIVYNDPEFNTLVLKARQVRLNPDASTPTPAETSLGFWAYSVKEDGTYAPGIPLSDALTETGDAPTETDSTLTETDSAPTKTSNALTETGDARNKVTYALKPGNWEVWEYYTERVSGNLNPIHPKSGARVIEKFFQPFEDHNPGKNANGLNWFFNDELQLGTHPGDRLWCDDFPEMFRKMKGYDLFAYLPGVCTSGKLGDFEAKFRMDYADVQMQLTEDRYFEPIYRWHESRGLIFGCDNNGRGLNPTEYGDYFRATRWYSAPGHDTPGGHADFLKGKVSSSVANLYRRPRVWLEGYHSLGWGASPAQLMHATNENFVYGCTLLNLHGLYYTTHGSMWEWAPPCYHFRQPYWKHMETFLKYFERLSFVMSQGTWQSDIAVLYPTAPSMANYTENQNFATKTAFDTARKIYASGRDVTFIDDQSIQRGEIVRNRLVTSAGMEFRAIILPGTEVVRWETILKLRDFARAGGRVICLEKIPCVSDHAGTNDPELSAIVNELFGENGTGTLTTLEKVTSLASFPRGHVEVVEGNAPALKYLHRKIAGQDVFLVMGVEKGARVKFHAVGNPEWWNPMTGERKPLPKMGVYAEAVDIQMPVTAEEAALIIFKLGEIQTVKSVPTETVSILPLDGEWDAQLIPTMDNQWGDFRLPVTPDNMKIGAEARRMRFHRLTPAELANCDAMTEPDYNDSAWEKVTYGFGEKFRTFKTETPINDYPSILEQFNSTKTNVKNSAKTGETDVKPYPFSWRVGIEGNPGHQGWHGLKESISDHFIGLGATKWGHNETVFVPENPAQVYYLQTQVTYAGDVTIQKGGNLPKRVWLDGQELAVDVRNVTLNGKTQTLVLEYTTPGRGFWFFEKGKCPERSAQTEASEIPPGTKPGTPLSMTWFDCDFVPFQKVNGTEETNCVMYRFRAPAGLQGMIFTLDEQVSELPEVFVDGKSISLTWTDSYQKRTRRAVCELPETVKKACVVAVRMKNVPETIDRGALFAEPIALRTGVGVVPHFGAWEDNGDVLDCYSGGILYTKNITVSAEFLNADCVMVRFPALPASAEVRINGRSAGILVASPWELNLTGFLQEGENRVEIEVYNTLRNHYHTIPTRYK
ncbi:MAG: glycosyl hydrolase [Planctomycetia bacterium]|nr:glycosyl hydrolase [Planctomycetia bacterium]